MDAFGKKSPLAVQIGWCLRKYVVPASDVSILLLDRTWEQETNRTEIRYSTSRWLVPCSRRPVSRRGAKIVMLSDVLMTAPLGPSGW
jgi:hypothetical protein